MAAYRRLSRPPIVEAVIDFRVRQGESVNAESLANASPEFKARYPIIGKMHQRAFEFSLAPGAQPSTCASATVQGARYDNKAKDRVAIFTVDGFTVSHVNRYTDWSEIRSDATTAWAEYSRLANPLEIVRVGLRYINRFEFATPIELTDYFVAAPTLPPELPQVISLFQSRVIFPLSDGAGQGALTHVLDVSTGGDFNVILDIDIFRENSNFEPSSNAAWELLDRFKQEKNKVFFASVTEHALERYK